MKGLVCYTVAQRGMARNILRNQIRKIYYHALLGKSVEDRNLLKKNEQIGNDFQENATALTME